MEGDQYTKVNLTDRQGVKEIYLVFFFFHDELIGLKLPFLSIFIIIFKIS